MKGFLAVGVYMLPLIFNLICAYGFYREGRGDLAMWAIQASMWIVLAFMADIRATRWYMFSVKCVDYIQNVCKCRSDV